MGRWDLDFRSGLAHIDAAEAALLGLPAGTTVCSLDAFLALIHPDDRDAVRNRVTEAVEHHGGAYAAEFRVVHPDGSERWLVGRGVIEADAQTGVPVRAIGINYDVTERRRADEALRASELQARASEQRAEAALREAQAANTAKDQFLAVLSHELRTPLAPVLLVTSMLLRSGLLPEALRDHVATIKRNVELEVKLIDDLLDLTRIARGKLELHLAPVDLAETTRQVVQMVQPDAAARDITVDVSLDALQCQVRGDAARLHQVLWNLLRNAVKFTPAGGRVTVRSRCVEDVVVVDVRDTGIGIEPHVMPRIFSAFDQGDVAITRQFGGLGLGLAISHALIELHGGTLSAESDGRDRGALFRIMLPRDVTGLVPIEGSVAPPPRADETLGVTVLLVEDHADTARITALLLRQAGYAVHTAASVREAIDILRSGVRLDLILSDLGLPDGSGIDLLERARTVLGDDALPPAVALSGFGMDHDIARSMGAGFRAHLVKPVTAERLHAALVTVRRAGPPLASSSPVP
jgi:hypothetical protein